ncbi:Mu transposase C-terminal domain-containing protein [Mycoplana dimorpha]|uniref:Putative transposase n=1 Tax=Mycoplana dimorpha TaxID=28320 RepID=A0A2T5BJA2_MYCDI|nr:Mu transposase C-terminal domain-containing protein [Mycoplana dimorpha]PTM99046.1 putative transposase [Mycoplana dimorpha]
MNQFVPRLAFGHHDKIVIDGVGHEPMSSDQTHHVLRRYESGEEIRRSHEELYQLRSEGRLLQISNGYYRASAERARRARPAGDLVSNLKMSQQETILWRKEYCDRFLRMAAQRKATRSDESMAMAISTITGEIIKMGGGSKRCGGKVVSRRPPSPTALRKWLRAYEAWNYDPMALRDHLGRSGNRKSRLPEEIRALLREAAEGYADSLKPSLADQHVALGLLVKALNEERKVDGLEPYLIPSVRTLSKEIAKLNDFEVMAAREGDEKANKAFYIVRGGLGVSRPLERIEIDEWNVSLRTLMDKDPAWQELSVAVKEKIERNRFWISVAIDCATRAIVGLHIVDGAPSSESAVATLRQVVSDKSAIAKAAGCESPWNMGSRKIQTICTDTGSAWYSQEFRAACADLGIEIMFPPAGVPQMRARIERVFSTFHKQLIARFHGRTFENVVAKGDYDPDAMAVLDKEELYQVLVRYVVDVYHNTPHEGLKKETPLNAWIRLNRQFGTEDTLDPDIARSIFGTTIEATIQKHGVRLFGLNYYHDELQRLRRRNRKKAVIVRVDQTDVGFISVRTEEGWLMVPCREDGMDGVSLHTLKLANEKIRREHGEQAKASRDVRLRAIADILAFSEAATERAGLLPPTYSSEQIRSLASVDDRRRRIEDVTPDERDFLAEDGSIDEIANPSALVSGMVPGLADEPTAINAENADDDDDDDDFFMEF